MATAAELAILLKLHDEFSAPLKQSQNNVATFGTSLGSVGKIAAGFALGEGLARLPGFLIDAGKAAAEDAASQARLKAAVDNTGASYGTYSKQIDAVISKGQALGFTDDQTRSALAILTAQTGNAEEAMKRYALAQDLSRGANIDVVTASRLLGKVTDENVNVLNRYGIAVQKGSSETELFAAIQQKFGGQAAAFADTTAGKMAVLSDHINELKESLGGLVIPLANAAIPLFTRSLDGWALAFHGVAQGANFARDQVAGFISTISNIGGAHLQIQTMAQAQDLLGQKLREGKGSADLEVEGLINLIAKLNEGSLAGANLGTTIANLNVQMGGTADHLLQLPSLHEAVVASEENAIRATNDHNTATKEAYNLLLQSQNPADQAIAQTHFQEIADQEAAKAKSAVSAAASAYAETLPGMIAELYKNADADRMRQQALATYNREMGIATDLEGNAIPTMQELVNAQLDSIDASKREAAATREAYIERGIQVDINGKVIKSFQEMVEEQKASILDSQQMTKATAEANKQLKDSGQLIDDTASSLNSLSSALDKATAGWHQMTDAESQSAAKANATNSANTKPNATNASGVATPAYSGGSVAFFSHSTGLASVPYDNYPAMLHAGEGVVTAAANLNAGGGSPIINITINNAGSIRSERDLVGVIRDALQGGALRGYLVTR